MTESKDSSISTPKQQTDETKTRRSKTTADMNVSVTLDEEEVGIETSLELDVNDVSSTDGIDSKIEALECAGECSSVEEYFQNEDTQEEKDTLTVEAIVPAKYVERGDEEKSGESAETAEDLKISSRRRIATAILMIFIMVLVIVVGVVVATAEGPKLKNNRSASGTVRNNSTTNDNDMILNAATLSPSSSPTISKI